MRTPEGEEFITETERENDVFIQYTATLDTDDTYAVLISKENALFPHNIQQQGGDRIDITSAYYSATMAINTDAIIKIGVITHIDNTNADIKYFSGLPFLTGGAKGTIVDSLRGTPSQVKCDFDSSGILQHGLTNLEETDVTAVNTGVSFGSPAGSISPGLGDIVLKYEETSAGSSIDFSIFLFYHNTD